MKSTVIAWYDIILAVSAAAVLWLFSFSVDWGVFWVKIVFSALCLVGLAVYFGSRKRFPLFDWKAILLGLVSAAVLYGIFWAGREATSSLLPFASGQVNDIYSKVLGPPTWALCLLLFFVTGPAEELFWRGFVQDKLMRRLGGWKGWAAATVLYAGFHIVTFNFILVAAAGVAGGFWGLMYLRNKRLAPLIVSHSVWSVFAFAVVPLLAPVA